MFRKPYIVTRNKKAAVINGQDFNLEKLSKKVVDKNN